MIIFTITLLLYAVENGSMSDGISEGTKGVSHEQERTERRVENIANGEIQEVCFHSHDIARFSTPSKFSSMAPRTR